MASLDDVMLALGRVQEGVDRLRDDFQDEKRSAQVSRTTIHHRLDEQAEQIGRLDTTVAVEGQIVAQLRDRVDDLKSTVDLNRKAIEPDVQEWRRMKMVGWGVSTLLAIGGLSVGAILVWMNEAATNIIRHWLRVG